MVSESGIVNNTLYGIGNEIGVRGGLDFNRVITSARFNRIYEGQYTQDSNARIYGDVEKENIIDENTVLLMHMDDDVVDATGRHSPSAVGSPSYVTSKSGFNKAIDFNGTDQYLTIADSDDWNITGDYTIEFLLRFNTINFSNGFFISHYLDDSNRWAIKMANGLRFLIENSGSYDDVAQNSTSGWTTGVWYHIAVVLEDSGSGLDCTIYRDGVSIASGYLNQKPNNYAAPLRIAKNNASVYVDAAFDEVRISRRAVYTEEFTPPTNPFGLDSYKIKFFANSENLYQIAEHSSVETSGNNIPLIGGGVGVGLSGVFDYNLGV